MWPLNEMIDETYTVYFRFCAEAGCPRLRPRRSKATWHEEDGYLLQGSGHDLYEKRVPIAEARRVCAADPKCTSFTANCATAGCEAETVVYFKSYDVPQKHIDGRPAAPQPEGAAGWHSFYVDAAERVEVCEEEDGGAALAGRG